MNVIGHLNLYFLRLFYLASHTSYRSFEIRNYCLNVGNEYKLCCKIVFMLSNTKVTKFFTQ